jgi:alanine-synthesizing transaminase
MFSSRLNWGVAPNPLSLLAQQKRAAGHRILDLTESNPTRAGFAYPREMIEACADHRALRYDPSPRGLASGRRAVAEYYAARGRKFQPDDILLTASTSEAYSFLFKLLADPGDEILTPRPSYPLFVYLAALESVRIRQYALRYDGSWHIDFSSFGVTPRTRAIVVLNPNNPTGSFLKAEEWERLESFGLPILCDEVFADYPFTAPPPATPRGLTFFMNGLSKIAGLPQMKLAWIAASGAGHEAALERLELIADTYLSVATPVQVALPALLASAPRVAGQIRERTRANLEFLRAASRDSAAALLDVEGGWYAIARIPRTRGEEEWALYLLAERDVLAQPGFFFDFEDEAYLILSLLPPPAIFEEGVRRILASV